MDKASTGLVTLTPLASAKHGCKPCRYRRDAKHFLNHWLQPRHVMFMQLLACSLQPQAIRPAAQLPAKQHAYNQQPFLQGSSAMQCPSTTVHGRRSPEGRLLIICMLLCMTRALGLRCSAQQGTEQGQVQSDSQTVSSM